MKPAFLTLALMAASPALAHPHIFVDTRFEVAFDSAGDAVGLRISWTYDDLISLTLLSERGMDEDFDGVLTEAELTTLNGFDMGWEPGFLGDTYVLLGDQALPLSGPADWTVSYENARLTSTHFRRFDAPVDLAGQPLVIQSYDPGYYTDYAVVAATATGADCEVALYEPDQAAADQILQDALAEYSGTDGAEAEFPAVGAAYAEEARVTCAAR